MWQFSTTMISVQPFKKMQYLVGNSYPFTNLKSPVFTYIRVPTKCIIFLLITMFIELTT